MDGMGWEMIGKDMAIEEKRTKEKQKGRGKETDIPRISSVFGTSVSAAEAVAGTMAAVVAEVMVEGGIFLALN